MKRLLMLLSFACTIATAPPAYADPSTNNDADFLKQLTDAGITYKDPAQTINVAKNVCDLSEKGTPAAEIKQNLEQRNSFAANGAANFMLIATLEYCPKHLGKAAGAQAPKS